MASIISGTSGYSFKQWKGNFYPDKLPERRFLEHYASVLPAVELNNTFYRTPTSSSVQGWCCQVPDTFQFSVKAPRRITHLARLKDVQPLLASFAETVSLFGPRLGCVLFQFPPQFSLNVDRLSAFFDAWPDELPTALEFRHSSWDSSDVRSLIREHGAAWVVVDDELGDALSLDAGTLNAAGAGGFLYLRLRRDTYTPQQLQAWTTKLAGVSAQRAFVFFKHEISGPNYARALNAGKL